MFTSNSLQNFKQIKQKTPEILHFYFFNVLQDFPFKYATAHSFYPETNTASCFLVSTRGRVADYSSKIG